MDTLEQLFSEPIWWSYLFRIGVFFLIALIARTVAWRLTKQALRVDAHQRRRGRSLTNMRSERVDTVQRLVSSFITFAVFFAAALASLSLFVSADSLVWMAGLFAGAFGFGLMPLVKDFFTGITYLFEDPYDVGEKVELLVGTAIEGVVENVNLRTTTLRSPTGELFHIPNGEIRVVRNFSRGLFSTADITLHVPSNVLAKTLDVLEQAAPQALIALPNLLKPWQTLSEDGVMGERVALRLVAQARYGKAAELRPRLLAHVQQVLDSAEIKLL